MASNNFIALIFIFVSLMVSPIAQAQGLGLGGLFGGLGNLGGLLGGLGLGGLLGGGSGSSGILGSGGILNLIHINGNVSCSLDGSSGVVNGVSTPAFANALVQLQCGGTVVSSATTNSDGFFSILLTPVQSLLSTLLPTLLAGCKIVVKTPLSTCNATLPSLGGLVSSLLSLGNTLTGLLNIFNIIPGGFNFNQTLN